MDDIAIQLPPNIVLSTYPTILNHTKKNKPASAPILPISLSISGEKKIQESNRRQSKFRKTRNGNVRLYFSEYLVEMADKELKGGSELGSVKAAINRYGGKVYKGAAFRIDPQADAPVSEEASSKAQELHIAKKTVDKINENRRSAETVTSQAEIELLTAKKIVRELTSQIEDLKAKAKQKIHEHELQTIDVLENRQYNDVMNTAEKLRKEIEEVNEEEVLVELAQIQARKELAAIEAQRKEELEKHSSKVDEAKKKINVLRKEVEHKKRLEEVLAITNSEADVLQNELNLIKEMDERIALSKNSELQSVNKELEAGLIFSRRSQ